MPHSVVGLGLNVYLLQVSCSSCIQRLKQRLHRHPVTAWVV